MPLKPAPTWGSETAAAIKSVGVVAGTAVTDAQLIAVWTKIKEVSVASLATGAVAPGTFQDGMAAPVSGVGGGIT